MFDQPNDELRAWLDVLMGPTPPTHWLTYVRPDAKPTRVAELLRAAGFADDQWHTAEEIAQAISVSDRSVTQLLKSVAVKNGAAPKKNYGLAVRARVGRPEYRIVAAGKMLLAVDVVAALRPILRDLDRQGSSHLANLSLATIRRCVGRLDQLLRGWDE